MSRRTRFEHRERGGALVAVVIFVFMAMAGAALFLDRSRVELVDSRQKAASVRALFEVHSELNRAHTVINTAMSSAASAALNRNVALATPEDGPEGPVIPGTDVSVETTSEDGVALPFGWYRMEAEFIEPIDGRSGVRKLLRQYVRDGTPLSNNFVAVVDDDLGLGGSPVNPGRPSEGEIHTNRHLYLMTPNKYHAHRLMAVSGMSYSAGATESNTVLLHPDNNFSADPLNLPLPSSLTSNPDNPDETLKAYALGSSPQSVDLNPSNPTYTVLSTVTGPDQLRLVGSDPIPSVQVNFDGDGVGRGIAVEGNVNTRVTFEGGTMRVMMIHPTDATKWIEVRGLPTPTEGVVFFDTRVDVGGVARRTVMQGDITTRTTLATTGNVDVDGSVRYLDSEGDSATKFVYSSDLSGVPESEWGTVPSISDSTLIGSTTPVEYIANKRPPGVSKESGDGFYDGNSVLGVVASQDVILKDSLPQNAEVSGAYLSLQKRLTLEGVTYNSSGAITAINGGLNFYYGRGGHSSVRRFGGLISYKRPATAIVTGSGTFYYGFKRGFSLFDEDMKQQPPPFFPRDNTPTYLGWELMNLGSVPLTAY